MASRHNLKLPRTTAEARAAEATITDFPTLKLVRSKRSPRQLPEHRDDVSRADTGNHCWKRHRATQYKIVNVA